MNKAKLRRWVNLLLVSVVGGVANTGIMIIASPHEFHDWSQLGTALLASAALSFFLYIRNSPPPIAEDDVEK